MNRLQGQYTGIGFLFDFRCLSSHAEILPDRGVGLFEYEIRIANRDI